MNIDSLKEMLPWLVILLGGAFFIRQGRAKKKLQQKVIEKTTEKHADSMKVVKEKAHKAGSIYAELSNKYRQRGNRKRGPKNGSK